MKVQVYCAFNGTATSKVNVGITIDCVVLHSTVSITLEIYAHVLDSMKRDAVNKMEAVIYKLEPEQKSEADKVKEDLKA